MSAVPERPYKGLARFDDSELDERFFFGRERETEVVAANLVASRLTVLYGPSGVGKSSLLRAGVLRRLRALVPAGVAGGDGEGTLPVIVDQWRDDPIAAIAAAAGARTPGSPAELAEVLADRAAEVEGEMYLVLDQMEEYFVYHGRDSGGVLREALAEILSRPELRVHLLLGIRDDALADLDALKGRVPGLFGNVLRLDHLDPEAARAAIVEPLLELEALGGPRVEAEPALVAAVVDQVASGRIERRLTGQGIVAGGGKRGRVEAPYLQLVMDRIWEVERARGSSVLHVETLTELGGSGRIVQQHLERALENLDGPERELVARLFNQLVTPSGTKIAHAVGDLSRYAHAPPERLEDVLRALAAERVVRALPGRNGGGARYEIFHDVLAGAVLDWGARHEAERALAEEREAARRRHRRLAYLVVLALVALGLMGLLTLYAFSQRSEAEQQAALASAARLKAEESAAIANAARRDAEASAKSEVRQRQKAVTFARAALLSEKKAKREASESRRQRQLAIAAKAEALRRAASEARAKEVAEEATDEAVIAKNDAVVAKNQAIESKQEALVSKDKAERATTQAFSDRRRSDASAQRARIAQTNAEASALVAEAVSRLSDNPEMSLQLALQAADKAPAFGLEGILRDSLIAMRAQRVLPSAGGSVSTVATSAGGASGLVRGADAVATSSDSSLALVPGAGGVARVFELSTGKVISTLRHGAPLNVAIFSPDGTSVATGGKDGVVLVWDTRSGRRVARFDQGPGIQALAFSPDGRLLASGAGEAARVWRLADRSQVVRLPHPFIVDGLAFNPAGTLLLTQARDVRLYRTGDWGPPVVLDQPGQIRTAAFAPVGSLVATGGRDDVATIWDSDGTKRFELRTHTGDVVELAWSPNGELLATASADNGGRVFRASTGMQETFLGAHTNQVVGIAFSPDGASIATASVDGSARIWAGPGFARHAPLLGHAGQVLDVSFTPDGSKVVTASGDGSARVWRPAVDPQLTVIGRHEAAGRAVAVSPDGTLIASVGLDNTLRLARRNGQIVRTIPHPARLVDVAFSSDGTQLITAAVDGLARVWRVRDGAAQETYQHGAPLTSAVFDRAGRRILTAGTDGIARIWPRPGGRPRELRHGGGAVAAAIFSPDGRRVATAGADSEARIWLAATGQLLGKLTGHHTDDLTSIAYSPDGRRLVTVSIDADGHLWDAATFKWIRAFSGHTSIVSDVAFSPDGRWIATAGPTTVGLWETRTGRRIEKGTPRLFLRGHPLRVRSVAFFPDSRRVASIGEDGTVRTYLCEICGTTGELIRIGRRRLHELGSNLSGAQRKKFIGG